MSGSAVAAVDAVRWTSSRWMRLQRGSCVECSDASPRHAQPPFEGVRAGRSILVIWGASYRHDRNHPLIALKRSLESGSVDLKCKSRVVYQLKNQRPVSSKSLGILFSPSWHLLFTQLSSKRVSTVACRAKETLRRQKHQTTPNRLYNHVKPVLLQTPPLPIHISYCLRDP